MCFSRKDAKSQRKRYIISDFAPDNHRDGEKLILQIKILLFLDKFFGRLFQYSLKIIKLSAKILVITLKINYMGSFVISKRKNGEFQFVLKAGNGQVILASEGYSSKAACDNGIESVRKNSQVDARFDRLEAKNGKFYFNLKATNGQIVGNSEMYESVAARDNGIASVAKNAPDADVKEEI